MKKLLLLSVLLISLQANALQWMPRPERPLPKYHTESSGWKVTYDSIGIRNLVFKDDPYQADIVGGRSFYGDVLLTYKMKDGIWLTLPKDRRVLTVEDGKLSYTDRGTGDALRMYQTFVFDGDMLRWTIKVENRSPFEVTIGDLAIAVPWAGSDSDDPVEIFEHSYTKHAFVSGDASFFYFTRFNGEGPYPMLLPGPGTPLEYYASPQRVYMAYIHSGHSGGNDRSCGWRQKHTFGILPPCGCEGSTKEYTFTLRCAGSYPQMRDVLAENGLMDIKVVPGLTLPRGHRGSFSLRSRCRIDSVTAEFPDRTSLGRRKCISDGGITTEVWDVEFSRLGENMLTVWFDGGRKTYLEFFSCQSPETLLRKRSAFLVNHQQWRDTGKWYDGLYGVYDMLEGELRGPDNPDYFDERLTYFLASDDPILGKAPFIASKNAVFPDAREIESLEYHIEHFVWGGLQRTGGETPYPYGVYGTPNWYINRHQDLRVTLSEYMTDRMRVWRTYDYPHVIMLWWEMYKIASRYPGMCRYASAEEYLRRAYETAKVYFQYPTLLQGHYYETFKWGAYNELVIPDIIDELSSKKMKAQADTLRTQWEKKVKYFIYDDRYPYRSEYAADRTAYESTYALADYALRNTMAPDSNSWYDYNRNVWYSHPVIRKSDAADFMERQLYANLSCRGVLENQWYILGSDFLHSSDGSLMSYMARMGGWGVLEYGLHHSEAPYDWIRLGYSSYLGQFGLVNAGDEESGYGWWYPGPEKDGAMGQAFTAAKTGRAWIGTEEHRRPWRYCGEGDLGMGAITRTAATILAQDPVFGWTLYGALPDAQVSSEAFSSGDVSAFRFVPDDGCRDRLCIVSEGLKLEMKASCDHFSGSEPVSVRSDLSLISVMLESTTGLPHTETITIDSDSRLSLLWCGKRLSPKKDRYGRSVYLLPVNGTGGRVEIQTAGR